MLLFSLILLSCSEKVSPTESGTPSDTGTDTHQDDSGHLYVDADGDKADTRSDCDDTDPEINPWAEEVCDEVDNDCDGEIDEGVADPFYPDNDGDEFGNREGEPVYSCAFSVSGYSIPSLATDCDDTNPFVSPVGMERCGNGLDDDCSGTIDDAEHCMRILVRGSQQNARLGMGASVVADVSGDGHADLMVAANPISGAEPVQALVWHGPLSDGEYSAEPDATLRTNQAAWSAFTSQGPTMLMLDGTQTVTVTQINNNADDTGAVYVVLTPLTGDIDATDGLATFTGTNPDGAFGRAVAGVSEDSGTALLIGAPGDDGAAVDAGAAYLFAGPISGAHEPDAAAAVVQGSFGGDNLGTHLSGADLTGDGLGDLLLTAPQNDNANDKGYGSGPGYAVLIEGPVRGSRTPEDADIVVALESLAGLLGQGLDVGDVNQDGYTDIILGDNTRAWLLPGPHTTSGEPETLASAVFQSDPQDSSLGQSVSIADDLSGDGVPDFLLGAHSDEGCFVVLGPVTGSVFLPQDADRTFPPTYAYAHYSYSAADLDGDGLGEILISEPGWRQPWDLGENVGQVGIAGEWSGW